MGMTSTARSVTRPPPASAVAYIEAEDLDDIILVGHSYGGTIISAVAEAIGERIRRLVYWNAFVLLDGESIDDVSPPPLQGHDGRQRG